MYIVEPSSRRAGRVPAPSLRGLGAPAEHDSLKAIRDVLPSCPKSFPTLPRTACCGSLGTTHHGREVHFYFFPGRGEERALVIGGVHGSELAGIEVAERLVERLHADAKKGALPACDVVVVPELFRDNAARARANRPRPGEDDNHGRFTVSSRCPKRRCKAKKPKVCVDPNRQFPAPGERFDPANPVDALGTTIEPENRMLLQLIADFLPVRVASVHGKKMPSKRAIARNVAAPGIFADPHATPQNSDPQEVQAASRRTQRDAGLALDMAIRFRQEYDRRTGRKDGAGRVAGNRLDATPTALYGKASHQCGTSLGGWGPHPVFVLLLLPPFGFPFRFPLRDPMTVITVEVRHYYPSTETRAPTGRETRRGVRHRATELEAHATALREVFLEKCAVRKPRSLESVPDHDAAGRFATAGRARRPSSYPEPAAWVGRERCPGRRPGRGGSGHGLFDSRGAAAHTSPTQDASRSWPA